MNKSSHYYSPHFLLLLLPPLLFHSLLSSVNADHKTGTDDRTAKKAPPTSKGPVTALYVFGDSTVDSGNNNFVETVFRSNFPPYGINFLNRTATGRFTDGRLATDFIVSYAGLKECVPPYLDPTLSLDDLRTGVSFASAATGYDPLTPRINSVIPMWKQLEYFKEYKERLAQAIGEEGTINHINKSVSLISAGTNDFVITYFGLAIRRRSFTIPAYHQFLLRHVRLFIQGLWSQGARKIAVVGLPPIGCLPIVITINSKGAFLPRNCVDSYSSIAREYNQMLINELTTMQKKLENQGGKIVYIDIYGPLMNMIHGRLNYGFDEVDVGCCGTGLMEASLLCNSKSIVCRNASKYVFWDSIHPTERTYYLIVKALQTVIDHLIVN